MISALEFYRLQKSKRLPAEKRYILQSTISAVSNLSNQIKDLENTKLIVAQNHEQPQTKIKTKKKSLKRARLFDKKQLNQKSHKLEADQQIKKSATPTSLAPRHNFGPDLPLSKMNHSSPLPPNEPSKTEKGTNSHVKSRRKRRKSDRKVTASTEESGVFELPQPKLRRAEVLEKGMSTLELAPLLVDDDSSVQNSETCIDDKLSVSSATFTIQDEAENDEGSDDEVPLNPVDEGYRLLDSLLKPISLDAFKSTYFGSRPFQSVGGNDRMNFCNWLNLSDANLWLTDEHLMFGKDVEFLGSEKSIDVSHAMSRGRAFRSVVWNHFNLGGSFRFNAPERFSTPLASSLHLLQEVIGGPISSALVLTSSNFTGSLLPVDMDADLFILQLEGDSNISCTASGLSSDLPRKNKGKQKIIDVGKAECEFSLAPGDVLYLPRFFQHSVKVHRCEHAAQLCILHHTAAIFDSCIIDFLKDLIRSHPHLSSSVNMMPVSSEKDGNLYPISSLASAVKSAYLSIAARLSSSGNTKSLKSELNANDAFLQEIADKIAVHLLCVTAAPLLLSSESACHVSEQGEIWCDFNDQSSSNSDNSLDDLECPGNAPKKPGHIALGVELEPDSPIRLVRRACLHLVVKLEGNHRLYHCMSNGRECLVLHEPFYLEIQPKYLELIKRLFDVYPESIAINDLPGDSIDEKIIFANRLYEVGLIITGKALPPCLWNDSD